MEHVENKQVQTEPDIKSNRRFKIIRLLNFFFIPAFLITGGMYAAVDFMALYPLIIILVISIVPLIFSLYYNNNGNFTLAGNIFGYTITLSLFVTCLLIGGSPAVHFYFLMYAIITLITTSINQKTNLFTMVGLNLVFFLFIELIYAPERPFISFPEEHQSLFEAPIFFLIFQTTFVIILYYKSITEKFERLLKDQTQRLYQANDRLEKQTGSLNDLNTELEERQQQIEEQSEILKSQKEGLQYANAQLEELVATKDKFFSIIAHDLKNPIGNIMGFSSLLEDNFDTLTSDKRNLYIKTISDSVKNTYQLLEDLLEWARSQNSQMKFNPEKIVLNPLMESNYQLLRENAEKKDIKLNITRGDESYIAFCDRNMINTVIRNLISNAIKFTPPGGEINITARNGNSGMVEISVTDTGIGIPEDQQKNLFRIDKSVSTKGTSGETGTGLGLILCKEFIEKNGGELKLTSEPGKGSTFSFTLPVNG